MSKSDTIKKYALAQAGAPYVYGATGQPCTPLSRRQQQAQYPKYAEQIAKYCPVLSGKQETCNGCKHKGRLAFDCAQLTRRAAEAAGLSLPSGAKSQYTKGDWAEGGPIDQLKPGKIAMLYRVTADGDVPHTGIALGDGTEVDARSHARGVVHQQIGSYPWTHYKILKGQENADDNKPDPLPVTPVKTTEPLPTIPPKPAGSTRRTLRVIRGLPLQKGEDVMTVQRHLLSLGYSIGAKGADGFFGWDTHRAVLAFQMAAFPTSPADWDGVIGAKTWNALAGKGAVAS